MIKLLKYTPTTKHSLNVIYASNNVKFGEIYQEVDGYYVFWSCTTGCLPEYVLKELADYLHELNKVWENIIKNDPSLTEVHSKSKSTDLS